MAEISALLDALSVFSSAPDKDSLAKANAWLQDFQHSSEAWATCSTILATTELPMAAKVFAAQTFRTKVTFDLEQVDAAHLLSLRDTLVSAFQQYHSGPRNILVQLCLAISGLALQLPAWENPVQSMIEAYGRNPETVPALLQFLTVFPEELTMNTRIPLTDEDYRTRCSQLLTGNAKEILEHLAMYINAPGVTHTVQAQVFSCLKSWVYAGEIGASEVAQTPLFTYAFEALASDELFDPAVDVLCELIHETQEIDDNMDVIQIIVPHVIALRPRLREHADDPEKVKGYARIFTEAGETYRLLLLQHTETFFPIVEAIGECSAYHDLDVVPITFPFWMRLAQSIGKKPSVSPLFVDAYKSLLAVIIRRLHFPADITSLSGQEYDSFRSFRHVMGDTLKDCCFVIGSEECLLAAYEMITTSLARGPSGFSWQEIEAPLFSLRSMGGEVDPTDAKVVGQILDLIPSLPLHPKVRYAALLVIARYSEWINMHPNYVPYQLQYISAGFEDGDVEVSAAAGQALKYLCMDCKTHLQDFLPQLHTFVGTSGAKLAQDEKVEVYEAIAYVISAMPMEKAAESLRTFSTDILVQIHDVTNRPVSTKEEIRAIDNALENLEAMLHVVKTFGDELPNACKGTCAEAWAVFDAFLAKYGTSFVLSERTTRVLRHGLSLFGASALPVAAAVLSRMASCFAATGYPGYLWVSGKVMGRFGSEEDPVLRNAFKTAYEISTQKMVTLLQEKSPGDIPDVLEDYVQMLLQMVEYTPDVFFDSSAFPLAFRATTAALTLVHSDIIFASLDLLSAILTHECLLPPENTIPPPQFPVYAAAIRDVMQKEGFEFTGYILAGLVGQFPEDTVHKVVTIMRVLASLWSSQLLVWLPPVLQQLPTSNAPNQAKSQFLADITSAVTTRQVDKVKYCVHALHRASRKARDRRRTGPLE
ncbi:ARM repeat-containing protein [Punctularia strigosozonata HHB-11173 SS5]|uniref:ARM repeat-containing protein n=1 Tax=Punctularia strigosozonata (strain HHB-11173) TaxID=741275 RepID=UPI0004417D66|nr:ARM repeat-containing protein [Punctularia strigosozonata HHB-11173 SS5]EIN14130.1 ARM repeat-containing protein [Punctularia strigosozonata HHB-11173 SS5]